MTNHRKVMQDALEALLKNHLHHVAYDDYGGYAESDMSGVNMKAMADLRAALDAPQPEPVAWMVTTHDPQPNPKTTTFACIDYTPAPNDGITVLRKEPLYAAPQAQQPLTDEQLMAVAVEDEFLLYCPQDEFNEIARAIERAHGIGVKP